MNDKKTDIENDKKYYLSGKNFAEFIRGLDDNLGDCKLNQNDFDYGTILTINNENGEVVSQLVAYETTIPNDEEISETPYEQESDQRHFLLGVSLKSFNNYTNKKPQSFKLCKQVDKYSDGTTPEIEEVKEIIVNYKEKQIILK